MNQSQSEQQKIQITKKHRACVNQQQKKRINVLNRPQLCTKIQYKENHEKLPILIMPDHTLVIFTQSPIYRKVIPYIASFADPIYRPRTIHQYRITKFSLYTAFVLHYNADQIVTILKQLSKNKIFPKSLQNQIHTYMKYAGKVKFYMQEGKYFIVTIKQIALSLKERLKFIKEQTIEQAQDLHLQSLQQDVKQINAQMGQGIQQVQEIIKRQKQQEEIFKQQGLQQKLYNKNEEESTANTFKSIYTAQKQKAGLYEITGDYFEVTRKLIQKNIPLMQQYDFLRDNKLPNIKLSMKPQLIMRFYQERAIKNVFIDQKARSGLVILPCGSGKTLVGILIIERIRKSSIVFCQSQVSAAQWKNQMVKWTTIDPNKIVIIQPGHKLYPKHVRQAEILITTYAMVGMKRTTQNDLLRVSEERQWGVCIADEVHKLPAQTFQQVLKKYKFHVKIGLTATPYRQDKKIDNLFFMIGPKVYQENWLDLVKEGCLARPYCIQIFCEMPHNFKNMYSKLNSSQLIHTANPEKFKVLQYLIKKHTKCHDKILVFCDRPLILEFYAKKLKHPFIHGDTKQQQRIQIFNNFKSPDGFNVLFLSRVGDTAIDLPCANVAIQVGMHYQSRRQEVQRMGRIMRAKYNPNDEYNAFFYSLVSLGTKQFIYSKRRQKCLVDQGFEYQILIAKSLNYEGMKLLEIDEKEYLGRLLSDHKEGDMFLQNREMDNEERIQAQVKIGRAQDKIIYEYENEQL